jgi:hypothetical protein
MAVRPILVEVNRLTGASLDSDLLLTSILSKISLGTLREYRALAIDLREGDLKDRIIPRISPTEAWGLQNAIPTITTSEIIHLKRNGVTADFIVGFTNYCPKMNVNNLIELRRNGVDSDYFNAVQPTGNYTVDDIIDLKRRGGSIQMIQELRR